MNEKEILKFIERLVKACNSQNDKLKLSLTQLLNIVEQQNIDPSVRAIVTQAIYGSVYLADGSYPNGITKTDVDNAVAKEREAERRRREMEAMNRGRC